MLFTLLFLFFQNTTETIQLTEKPLKENAVTLTELVTLEDKEDGYYDGIEVYLTKNSYYVYDRGNYSIIKYDLKGHELLRFGKEGQGPGELAGYEQITHINSKYIYLAIWDKLKIFSIEGKLIKEVKPPKGVGYNFDVVALNDSFLFIHSKGKKRGYASFTLKGDLINKFLPKEEIKDEPFAVSNFKSNVAKWYLGKSHARYFGNKTIYHERGDYEIFIKGENGKEVSLKRKFERVPVSFDSSRVFVVFGNDKKKQREANQKYMQSYLDATNGREPAIKKIIGFCNGYMFVQASSEDKEEKLIDVISPDYKFYTQLSFKEKDVTSISLKNNKFVVIYKNDEVGLYSKVYSINL